MANTDYGTRYSVKSTLEKTTVVSGGDQAAATSGLLKVNHFSDTIDTELKEAAGVGNTWSINYFFGPLPAGAIILPGSSLVSEDLTSADVVAATIGYTSFNDKGVAYADSEDIVDGAGNQLTDINAFATIADLTSALDQGLNTLAANTPFVVLPNVSNKIYLGMYLTADAAGALTAAKEIKINLLMATA